MSKKESKILPIADICASWVTKWIWDDMQFFLEQRARNPLNILDISYFICLNTKFEIVGYVCYASDARLPEIEQSIYTEDFFYIHFGVRPDLRETDIGVDILKRGMEYMSDMNINHFRATISTEDEHTIKMYERVGFFVDETIMSPNEDTFLVMSGIWED